MTTNYQGFGYRPMKDLGPHELSEHRQPLRWLLDSGEGSTHTASLRSRRSDPSTHLQEVMKTLQFKSICLFVVEMDGSPVLYVHCMTPISETLGAACLSQLTVQRQHVLFFMLKAGTVSHGQIQDALNLWITHRAGFNAAVVHSPSDMLVIFANETVVEPVPECFQVSLAIWGNSCPLLEAPTAENASIWLTGTWASIQELNTITRALVALKEPGIVRIEVDEGWSQIRIHLRSMADSAYIRDVAAQTLRDLGRRCAIKCNKVVLYQCAIPLGPFEAVVDLSHREAPSEALEAFLADTDAALSAHKKDLVGDDFAYDVVMHLLGQLPCEAILRHNYRYSFDLEGMKCPACVQLILEELFLDRPGRVGYTHIALSPTRNVLAVQVPAEQRHAVEPHVRTSLQALGISARLIGEGPDLTTVDDPQAISLYAALAKPHPPPRAPCPGTTLGVRLGAGSVQCEGCARLLRATVLRLLPAVNHLALDCAAGTMVVGLGAGVRDGDVVRLLAELGYQPTTFYVPPTTGAPPPAILPTATSPVSPSHYFSPGAVAAPMANGQLNPYALSQPATPTSRSSHSLEGLPPAPPFGTPRGYPEYFPWAPHPPAPPPVSPPPEAGSTVLVFNHHPAGPLSITVPMRLRHRYTVWYDNVRTRVQLQQSGEAECSLTEVASFQTMPEFWQIWEQLAIEGLEEGAILILFRSDIPPDHNHVANRAGGRWFVRGVATEPRAKLWTKLALAMLSDTLTANSDHEVCGVVLSVKPSGDRIEIWVDGGYHHTEEPPAHDKDSGQYLPNLLTSLLGDELGHRRFHFWTHAGFERHRKSHRGSVRRAKRNNKVGEPPLGPPHLAYGAYPQMIGM